MGNKTTIVGMVALVLVCIGYAYFLRYEYSKHPNWNPQAGSNEAGQTAPANPSPAPAVGLTTTEASTGPSPATAIAVATTQAAARPATIGSDRPNDQTFALGLHLTPAGAALASVSINSYKATNANDLYVFQQPVDLTGQGPLATRSVTVDGQNADLSQVTWQLAPGSTATDATYAVVILSLDRKPMLLISKTYRVRPRPPEKNRDNTSAGYEADVSYLLQNLSG